jgi:hypothetical protein
MFTISSSTFHTQEWSNLARHDVSRLRLTLPLVSILVGCFHTFHLMMEAELDSETVGFYRQLMRLVAREGSIEFSPCEILKS